MFKRLANYLGYVSYLIRLALTTNYFLTTKVKIVDTLLS
jgi:hypothetical protein